MIYEKYFLIFKILINLINIKYFLMIADFFIPNTRLDSKKEHRWASSILQVLVRSEKSNRIYLTCESMWRKFIPVTWQEEGEQAKSTRSPARMSAGGIKWLSGVERDSDISVHTSLNNKNKRYWRTKGKEIKEKKYFFLRPNLHYHYKPYFLYLNIIF